MMNLLKTHKRIIGVVVFLIGFAFLLVPTTFVFAADPASKECTGKTSAQLSADRDTAEEKYKLSISTYTSTKSFIIEMKPENTSVCNQTFKVTKVGGKEYTGTEKILGCGKSVIFKDGELSSDILQADNHSGLNGLSVQLSGVDVGKNLKLFKSTDRTKYCYYPKLTVKLEITIGEEKVVARNCPVHTSTVESDSLAKKPNCNLAPENQPTTFAREFCESVNGAKEEENKKTEGSETVETLDPNTTVTHVYGTEEGGEVISSDDGAGGAVVKEDINLKCNYDLNSGNEETQIPATQLLEQFDDNKYFVNKQYFYAKHTFTERKGNYQYEVDPGHVVTGEPVECKITCEEAVKVEYGPPVATKAGACFEYKVRVTSRVNCVMTEAPQYPYPIQTDEITTTVEEGSIIHEQPGGEIVTPGTPGGEEGGTQETTEKITTTTTVNSTQGCSYCTPVPTCYGYGKVWRQGGPSEEYDACIQSCDGGKYTKKCSNKCFQEVYSSSVTAGASVKSNSLDLSATNVNNALKKVNNPEEDYKNCVAYFNGKRINSRANLVDCVCTGFAYGGDSADELYGCYYGYGTKNIVWEGIYDTNSRSDCHYNSSSNYCKGIEGRWYSENTGNFHNGNYILPGERHDGFWRHVYKESSEFPDGYCDDKCQWNECRDTGAIKQLGDIGAATKTPTDGGDSSGGTGEGGNGNTVVQGNGKPIYINDGYSQRDFEKNMNKRDAAIKACEKRAVCNTTESTYTISADYLSKKDFKSSGYRDTKKITKTYEFPLESNGTTSDYIQHGETNVTGTFEQEGTTILTNYPENGEGRLGCYIDGGRSDTYRSTWGFPGAWRNKKTAEISFKPKEGAWLEIPDRFCLPTNSAAVNVEWYNQYYARYYEDLKQDKTSQEKEVDKCKEIVYNKNLYNLAPLSVEQWNIHAHAENFGYFGWNINIECFYATNPSPSTIKITKQNQEVPIECGGGGEGDDPYTIRTVDLENMFPAAEYSGGGGGGSSQQRVAGFNWSEYATVDEKHGDGYTSNPAKYLDAVQMEAKNKGDKYYDEDKLDYEFYITRSQLLELRSKSKSTNSYGSFADKDFALDTNGISRYTSRLIREGSFDEARYPQDSALMCNIIYNYKRSECDNSAHGS